MSWVTIIWSMSASACLTLALIHLLIWSRQRSSLVNLLFSTAAIGTAALALCELIAMRAQTPAEYALVIRWGHVPVWVIVVSLCGFAKFYFRVQRARVLWAAVILRTIALALNFLTGANLNYLHITALRHVRLFNESVSVPTGVPNPAMVVGQLSLLLLVVGIANAARSSWKRGERQRAVVVGGSIAFFLLASSIEAALVFWGNLNFPITVSLFYLGFVLAMSYELSSDVLEAGRLARELRASDRRMIAAAETAMLGEISSAFAHELNQPLAAILSNAQAAQRFMATENFNRAEIRDILADIVSDNQRASQVIFKMRNLLRKGAIDPQSLDGTILVHEVVKLLNGDLSARGISVSTEFSGDLPPIYGDPIQFQQVLINLVQNAADSMADNPPDRRTMTIRLHQLDNRILQFCVADMGKGIPAGQEEKIFDPYHTTKETGVGLGLYLSRTIAVAYGGELTAQNRPEGGAMFCFNVPAAQGKTA